MPDPSLPDEHPHERGVLLTDEQIDGMLWPAPLNPEQRELVRQEYACPDPSGRSERLYRLHLELGTQSGAGPQTEQHPSRAP